MSRSLFVVLSASLVLGLILSSCSSPMASTSSASASATPKYVTSGYTLVWSDEFNTGTAPDPTKWNYDIGTGTNGWGNNELEYYTSRPQNIYVANGCLNIVAQKESYNGSSYTSARINTKGKFQFTYGKIVARIALSSGGRTGIWPAFWMLGANIDTVGWPQCGEMDIMENKGTSTVYSTLHWWNELTNTAASYGQTTSTTINGFHDYELEWTPTYVYGRVDGVTYFTIQTDPTVAPTLTEFQQPFFILLNQAVGGSFAGRPNGTTTFPSTMQVDYIRVYQ